MIKRFLSNKIKATLENTFKEAKVEVLNESYLHSKGENSHFKVKIVTDEFLNQSLVNRQRFVNKALKEYWSQGVHSISIHAVTLSEGDLTPMKSPHCMNQPKNTSADS